MALFTAAKGQEVPAGSAEAGAGADSAAGSPPIFPEAVQVDVGGQVKPQVVGREFFIGEDDFLTGAAPPSPRGGDAFAEAAANAQEDEARHTEHARLVSVLSLVASFLAAVLGLGIGYAEATLSLVGFGLEASLDGLSSALVLWRFKKPKQRQHRDDEAAAAFKVRRDAKRERNSSIGIGATFVASAALLLALAAYKLVSWDPHDLQHVVEEKDGANYSVLLSVPSAVVFGALALAKFRLARVLGSQVLEKDALCSVLGAGLALICSVAGIIEEFSGDPDKMVMVDSVASAFIAVILLAEGSRTLWHNLGTGWQEEHRTLA